MFSYSNQTTQGLSSEAMSSLQQTLHDITARTGLGLVDVTLKLSSMDNDTQQKYITQYQNALADNRGKITNFQDLVDASINMKNIKQDNVLHYVEDGLAYTQNQLHTILSVPGDMMYGLLEASVATALQSLDKIFPDFNTSKFKNTIATIVQDYNNKDWQEALKILGIKLLQDGENSLGNGISQFTALTTDWALYGIDQLSGDHAQPVAEQELFLY